MIRFGVIGTGWRTEFFLRIAQAAPDQFACVGVVTRDKQRAAAWAAPFGVTLFENLDDLLAEKPLYVITSVPWDVNPTMLHQLAQRGIPALSETPPATTLDEMIDLYKLVQGGAKIAVAEQYFLQPDHAARLSLVKSGKLGSITQAQVSIAHGYHGISLMRRLLGIAYDNVTITGRTFTAPIVKSPDRSGAPDHEEIVESEQAIATFDFGNKLGIFDFTGDQYFSYIRGQRILVRGERGEIVNHSATYLHDHTTPIHLDFKRVYAGAHGNHEGFYLKGIQVGEAWHYRNPVPNARLADDEIAVADCLIRMADYADSDTNAAPFYPLAVACQDRYLDIVMWQAINDGKPVTSETQIWAT